MKQTWPLLIVFAVLMLSACQNEPTTQEGNTHTSESSEKIEEIALTEPRVIPLQLENLAEFDQNISDSQLTKGGDIIVGIQSWIYHWRPDGTLFAKIRVANEDIEPDSIKSFHYDEATELYWCITFNPDVMLVMNAAGECVGTANMLDGSTPDFRTFIRAEPYLFGLSGNSIVQKAAGIAQMLQPITLIYDDEGPRIDTLGPRFHEAEKETVTSQYNFKNHFGFYREQSGELFVATELSLSIRRFEPDARGGYFKPIDRAMAIAIRDHRPFYPRNTSEEDMWTWLHNFNRMKGFSGLNEGFVTAYSLIAPPNQEPGWIVVQALDKNGALVGEERVIRGRYLGVFNGDAAVLRALDENGNARPELVLLDLPAHL